MKISIENLSKVYNGKTIALQDVDLKIEGGVFGLLGRNGAGKSTLMKILATSIRPTSGLVSFDGLSIFKNLDAYRGSLGYLPQSTRLMPGMDIFEFLDYICILKGINNKAQRKAEIERCTEIVGLQDEYKKRLGKYSGGMLRRAGIAQALIGSPNLLIIDEPTTGLDPEERLYFLNLLSRISANQTTIFSTHIIHDIESICENLCILKVIYKGAAFDLIKNISGNVWEVRVKPGEEEQIKEFANVVSVAYSAGKPVVRYVSEASVWSGSEPAEAALEDAYIHALGGVKR